MKHGFQLANEYEAKKHPGNAIAEVKQDGFMVLVEEGRLWVRGGINREPRDETFRFPEINVDPAVVLVGELVILKDGISQFNLLLRRKVDNPKEIRLRSQIYPATLIAFDLLELNGQDLQGEPLSARRKALESLEHTRALNGHVHVADFWGCPPEKVPEYLEFIRGMNGEGIMVKNLDSPYVPKRNDAWMKVKAWESDNFDIQRHEITENGGFVVWIANKGYAQKVVVNDRKLADQIAKSEVTRVRIRYLEESKEGALRQPHIHGVPWDK